MKDRRSVHLYHGFDRRTHSEWTLFGLAGDIGARLTSETSTEARKRILTCHCSFPRLCSRLVRYQGGKSSRAEEKEFWDGRY
jgi:hypothetical protein